MRADGFDVLLRYAIEAWVLPLAAAAPARRIPVSFQPHGAAALRVGLAAFALVIAPRAELFEACLRWSGICSATDGS